MMRLFSPLNLRRAKYLDTNSSVICTRGSCFCRLFKFRIAACRSSLEIPVCSPPVRNETLEAILRQNSALKAVKSSQTHHDKLSGAREGRQLWLGQEKSERQNKIQQGSACVSSIKYMFRHYQRLYDKASFCEPLRTCQVSHTCLNNVVSGHASLTQRNLLPASMTHRGDEYHPPVDCDPLRVILGQGTSEIAQVCSQQAPPFPCLT